MIQNHSFKTGFSKFNHQLDIFNQKYLVNNTPKSSLSKNLHDIPRGWTARGRLQQGTGPADHGCFRRVPLRWDSVRWKADVWNLVFEPTGGVYPNTNPCKWGTLENVYLLWKGIDMYPRILIWYLLNCIHHKGQPNVGIFSIFIYIYNIVYYVYDIYIFAIHGSYGVYQLVPQNVWTINWRV